jgi:Protein of unknown function (DUF2934)
MSQQVELERAQPLEQQIAARAYERWMRRGCPSGDGAEDWFAARAELEAELARKSHDLEVALFDE